MKKNTKQQNKKVKKRKLSFIKLFLLFIILFLIAVIAYFIIGTVRNGGGKTGLVATAMGQTQEEIQNLKPFSALLLGSSQNMTDTIMIFKYNPQTQKAFLISIPRDTFVGANKTTATASQKINSLYRGQFPEKTLAAVNKITGLKLEYYVVVDTEALRALVDAIGGVYFDVPIDMKYTDKKQGLYINLKQGYQLLDGNKAEQVVRFRHNQDGTSYSIKYGDNDIGRMKTQRNFLKAVMKQTLTPSNIFNIGKFIDIAQTYVKTNIPIEVMKQYVASAVNFDVENLETGTLPGYPQKCNGVWLYIANTIKIKKYLIEMSNQLANVKELTKEELTSVKIEILNGTGSASKLAKAKQSLKDAGFTVTKTGTTNKTEKTSIINKTEADELVLSIIQNLLEIGDITSSTSEESKVNVTIILGKDFK